MARTGDVLFNEKQKLTDKLTDKYSKEAIEGFLGIVIKEVDKSKYLYNIYMDGELVLPKVTMWDIQNVFDVLGTRFARSLCEESAKEDNLEETERRAAEREAMEIKNEQENYYVCPICYDFVKKGTHFHI